MTSITPQQRSDISVVVQDIATKLTKIKQIQEDILESAKGIAEKIDDVSAQDIKKMGQLHYERDKITEKQESAQKPFDLYDLVMSKG